jgi:CheY-like chemotaxis protein
MDLQMPVMSGVEATKIIREEVDKDLPIVALTGSATEEQLKEAMKYGLTDYCLKPISLEKIQEVILKNIIE